MAFLEAIKIMYINYWDMGFNNISAQPLPSHHSIYTLSRSKQAVGLERQILIHSVTREGQELGKVDGANPSPWARPPPLLTLPMDMVCEY